MNETRKFNTTELLPLSLWKLRSLWCLWSMSSTAADVGVPETGRFLMLVEVAFQGKGFPASSTDVRLEAGVGLLVSPEVRFVGKALGAHVARVGFFSGVGTHVSLKEPRSAEPFSAEGTDAVPAVSSEVHGKGRLAGILLSTLLAFVGVTGERAFDILIVAIVIFAKKFGFIVLNLCWFCSCWCSCCAVVVVGVVAMVITTVVVADYLTSVVLWVDMMFEVVDKYSLKSILPSFSSFLVFEAIPRAEDYRIWTNMDEAVVVVAGVVIVCLVVIGVIAVVYKTPSHHLTSGSKRVIIAVVGFFLLLRDIKFML